MKVCFFAKVASRDILATIGFYAIDIRILRELGHDVVVATRWREIPRHCDLYFVWWWTWAFVPMLRAGRRPALVTGTFDYRTHPGLPSYERRPLHEKLLIRFALRRAQANIFVSRYEQELVPRHLKVTNPTYVPHGVDISRYVPVASPREPFLFNVAWSSTASARRKCLPQILAAFARVHERQPGVRLVLAGMPGDHHPTLVREARRLGVADAVEFIGVVSEDEKIRLMQRCAVYLQPTLFEGFGLAIAEAMACGAPVVTSPVGGVTEVAGDAARLVSGEDVEAIASAVLGLLEDPGLRDDLGRRARERIVARFAYERRRDGIAAVIDQVARPGVPRPRA